MSQTVTEPAVGSGTGDPSSAPEPRAARMNPTREITAGTRVTAVLVGVVVFTALMTGMIGLIVHLGNGTSSSATPSVAGAASNGGAPLSTSVDVTLGDLFMKPSSITVPKGEQITFHVKNTGALPHNLTIGNGVATPDIPPGRSVDLKAGPFDKSFQAYCSIPGHKQAGMVMQVNVGSASSSAGSAAMSATNAAATNSTDAKIDFNASPASGWHAFDPTLKPADGATVHNITIHAGETVLEVAPGVRQQMWTFNGQVPGPVLRGHIGDVFNVTLVNDGTMGHSIDFHASKVSPDVMMKTLQPGQSLVYQFKADYAGIWMYHCGTAPALHHIGNGMYGAVVIDPPGLPPVDHEYLVVQSELYLGPQGQPGDLAKMQSFSPDAVVFNGYVNQYKYAPIHVSPGQRIRVWVLDAGPNENSSFHIVGTIFDTVYKEGHYDLRPDGTHGGSQALDLEPAQGGFVEFTLDQPGNYTMVTHKFVNVGKGALGVFQAGDVSGTMSH